MKLRTDQDKETVRLLIAKMGMFEFLELLSEIAEGHAQVQLKNNLPVGASKSLSAGLSELAENYAIERNYEIQGKG